MTVQRLELLVKCPTVNETGEAPEWTRQHYGKTGIFVLNVDWCLLFNLLPQLLWHIVNRTLQLNQRCPCVCTASVTLVLLLFKVYSPQPLTLRLRQQKNVSLEVLNNYWYSWQYYPAPFIQCSYKIYFYDLIYYNMTFQAVNLFYAFINYCKKLFTFHTSYVHTMHWFSLYLYQLNELDLPSSLRV